MKLVLCTFCSDVFKLARVPRACDCGTCGGYYKDSLNAVYWGDTAIPIGFNNRDLRRACAHMPPGPGRGETFEAFVIPRVCQTMIKLDTPPELDFEVAPVAADA